ncbi:unnamed protein product [Anisakis simplex]|uniref:Uncharacterized protein n=1 Tax=Anisakis simplex TaxID=6269 RepID=A0A3P6T124_ANISI|nr:unnamed protein product [Anisakis simplex]
MHWFAETPGISQCYDAQGRSVGKVVADKTGNTVIYNDKDVPIATGTVQKLGDRSYQAVISKNLFIAKLKDARTSACCREVNGQPCIEPIKVANPSFHHSSEREGDGTLKLTWPDCFDMSIDVTLPPSSLSFFARISSLLSVSDLASAIMVMILIISICFQEVHINRLAMKLDVMVQPIGKLRCMDVATCGRECFYCDWCKNTRKLKLLENTDGNLCRATDERTYRLTVKLCPPPEDPNFTMCSAFSKSVWQKDYWQKQGAIDIWMKFYERGDTRAEVFTKSHNQGSYTPTNSELLEYWVSKRNPDRLLACEHSVVDYEIEGAKVKTNLLFEAATTANSLPNIFKDKKCAAFERLQENRFQAEAKEYRRKNGASSIFGGFGNFFPWENKQGATRQ